MKSRFTTSLLVLVVLTLLFSCSGLDNDTLATVDGKILLLEEFTSKNPVARFANKDHAFIDSKVDDFVIRSLFTQAALDKGLDKKPGVSAKVKSAERRQMLQYVYDRAIIDELISEESLRKMYDHSGKELNARHILIQFAGGPRSRSDRSKDDARALMSTIKKRLADGEDFKDLAKEFTEDPSGKDSGGDLGWFGWGGMVGPFQDAAFALKPGEVSAVVETTFGFHIIKLEAVRDVERGSFDEEKVALKNKVRQEKGPELSQFANKFLQDIKSTAKLELFTENIHAFFMVFDKSSYKQNPLDEVFQKLNYRAPLLTINGQELGGNWIIGELSHMEDGQKPRFSSENQLKTILDQLVTQKLIYDFGLSRKYEEENLFSEKLNTLIERFAYEAFIRDEVNLDLDPNKEELMAFYEANKADKYMDKKKVQVCEIFVKDSLMAVDLKKRIDAGEAIGALAGRYTERKATKDKQGELPPFQEGRYGTMGKEAFSLEVGEIAGPIKLGNGYSIIKLERVIPAGPKSYAKVKGRVKTEIMSELRSARTATVYAELKKDYPVKINYSAVHRFYDAAASE